MNLFRIAGDFMHIISFIILLHKIIKGKSAAGISLRTQELYAGVANIPPLSCLRLACKSASLLLHSRLLQSLRRPLLELCLDVQLDSQRWPTTNHSPPRLSSYFCRLPRQVCFIGASLAIVYFMRFGTSQKASYNPDLDNFPVVYLLAPCALSGMLVNQGASAQTWHLFV